MVIAVRTLSAVIPRMGFLSYQASSDLNSVYSNTDRRRNAVLLFVVVVAGLLGVEVASRALAGIPILDVRNFFRPIASQLDSQEIDSQENIRHERLGWTYPRDQQTNPLGLIPNGTGSIADWVEGDVDILVVGDSFSAGPWQSNWPNQVAEMSGQKVINGAVGGYGLDQIYLRARQLVPIIRPSLLFVSFIPDDLRRAELNIFQGHAKPVFRIAGGELKLDVSAINENPGRVTTSPLIGYSHGVFRVAQSFGFDVSRLDNVVHDQGRVLGCRLMSEFASLAETYAIDIAIILQFSGHDISPRARNVRSLAMASHAAECARTAGLRVIDSLAALRPLPLGSEIDLEPILRRYWRYPEDPHMSAQGDTLVARTIWAVLSK